MVCETGVLRPWACAHALFTFSLAGEQVSAWVTNPGIAAYAPFSHRLEAGSFGYGFASVHRPPRELGTPSSFANTKRQRQKLLTRGVSTVSRRSIASPLGAATTNQDVDEVEGENSGEKTAGDDNGTPIYYIRGLKEGGGIGAWGDTDDFDGAGDVDSDEAYAAAMQSAQSGNDEAGDKSTWDKMRVSMGLGTLSYVGLGLALFILILNNTLGPGWLGRFTSGDFDTEGIENIENQAFQVMPLDGPNNLLAP